MPRLSAKSWVSYRQCAYKQNFELPPATPLRERGDFFLNLFLFLFLFSKQTHSRISGDHISYQGWLLNAYLIVPVMSSAGSRTVGHALRNLRLQELRTAPSDLVTRTWIFFLSFFFFPLFSSKPTHSCISEGHMSYYKAWLPDDYLMVPVHELGRRT